MKNKTDHPEYRVWAAMRERCNNPKADNYKHYGARGIRVCERWNSSFQNFLDDMGQKPSCDYVIERTNNNGNYEPDNCVWQHKSKKNQNRRTFKCSKTGITGVAPHSYGGFNSYLERDGIRFQLGRYKTVDEAAAARRAAERMFSTLQQTDRYRDPVASV